MALLIEIGSELPGLITVEVGDLVVFDAPGGVIESGTAVEQVGVFVRALPGPDGDPLVPQGPPNVVLFRAARPGEASLRITVGHAWAASPRGAAVQVRVRNPALPGRP